MEIPLELACKSRELFERTRNIKVALSIGSFGALLANGSEYTGDFGPANNLQLIYNSHHDRMKYFLAGKHFPDIILFETIPSYLEIQAIARLARENTFKLPFWVSLYCQDECLLGDGTDLMVALQILGNEPSVKGIGVNCISPTLVLPLIRKIQSALQSAKREDIEIIAYPNSGEIYDPEKKTWKLYSTDEQVWKSLIPHWIEAGASVLGGCCRTGPAHVQWIKGLKESFEAQNITS
jgi:homocysteine S-methyltransferase